MPKFDEKDPANAELISLFEGIGLSNSKAIDNARSPHAAILKDIISSNGLAGSHLDEKKASLLAAMAAKKVQLGTAERAYCVETILNGKITSNEQVGAATKYLSSHPCPVNEVEFNQECGIGVNMTMDDIYSAVEKYISSSNSSGWSQFNATLGSAKGSAALRWANAADVKTAAERVFTDKFGPKNATKQPAPANTKAATMPSAPTEDNEKTVFEEGFLGRLHKPGGNPQLHDYLREKHLATTKGRVMTRFPPEPNGYLHIGHSKAIFVDFGYASHYNGSCYLRYDDTNPEAEEGRYFESILETVRWLGYEPYSITYSSDYFQKLYELAVELIKRDKAYICHCTAEEMHILRGGKEGKEFPRKECSHRNRPVEESLALFEEMKRGMYQKGDITLRMKQDMQDGNTMMWDLVAYRAVSKPHHRTGDQWRIYPTYDFTHCLVDSIENISHSLCTTEFVSSRQSYEWLCDALEVYKPRQSEFGRLSLEGTITSKRKILKLVTAGKVRDWDDPRLYTLVALRRRGVPPGAIISFVSSLGVSTAMSITSLSRFEQTVRQYLENSAPRLLMVLRPLKVVIENLTEDYVLMIEKPLHPKHPTLGTSTVPFTRTIYIDADDFRIQDSKDYFRLAPGKTVGLFQAPHPITCTSVKTDPKTGDVVELRCHLEDGASAKKPKAFIQWVAEHAPSASPVKVDETRIFHRLFKSDNPSAAPDFLADVNENTLEIVRGAMLEVGFWPLARKLFNDALLEAKTRTEKALVGTVQAEDDDTPRPSVEQLIGNECVRFQGLRVAYFALDKDAIVRCLRDEAVGATRSPGDVVILNRIVSLKEDSGKSAM